MNLAHVAEKKERIEYIYYNQYIQWEQYSGNENRGKSDKKVFRVPWRRNIWSIFSNTRIRYVSVIARIRVSRITEFQTENRCDFLNHYVVLRCIRCPGFDS